MATRVQTIVYDDLDNSTGDVGTHHFALEGVDYEIDLSDTNLQALRAALTPFISAARRRSRTGTRRAHSTGKAANAAIRAWWAQNADTLGLPPHQHRGGIPAAVTRAYQTR